jgi:hypothetical protein
MSELINDVESIARAPGFFERYLVFALVAIAACAISFGTGYLYRAHVDGVKQAAVTATIKTADKVAVAAVAAADTSTDKRLQTKLNAANARAASLQQQIEAARNANPPAPDCRLPDGLRDALSRDLAGHPGEVQAAVQ